MSCPDPKAETEKKLKEQLERLKKNLGQSAAAVQARASTGTSLTSFTTSPSFKKKSKHLKLHTANPLASLAQLKADVNQAQADNHSAQIEGDSRILINRFFAQLHNRQAPHQLMRRNKEQELINLLKPLNSLNLQTISKFTIQSINTLGGRLGFFEQNLELDIYAFIAKSYFDTHTKLKKLLNTTRSLHPEHRAAFENILDFLNIPLEPINCRIQRAFKFFTPRKKGKEEKSLISKVKIQKGKTVVQQALDAWPVVSRLDFDADVSPSETAAAPVSNPPNSAASSQFPAAQSFSEVYSEAYFKQKHALDIPPPKQAQPSPARGTVKSPVKSIAAAVASASGAQPESYVYRSPAKPSPKKQANAVVAAAQYSAAAAAGAAPVNFSPRKGSPVKTSPHKPGIASEEYSKMVRELKEKNDTVLRLETELSEMQRKLLKVMQARTKQNAALAEYGVRELGFVNKGLAEKLKIMELNNIIQDLRRRLRSEQLALDDPNGSQNNYNNAAQGAHTAQNYPTQPPPIAVQNNVSNVNNVANILVFQNSQGSQGSQLVDYLKAANAVTSGVNPQIYSQTAAAVSPTKRPHS